MALLATLIGTPIGIMAGTYLAEFGQRGWLAPTTRFINDILLSRAVHRHRPLRLCRLRRQRRPFFRLGRHLRAGAHRHTRGAANHREHAAPGAQHHARSRGGAGRAAMESRSFVTLRAARAGIITGVLLAVARISGETAPLLFTALNNQFWRAT